MPSVVAIIPTLGNDIHRLNRAIRSVREFTKHDDLSLIVINNALRDLPPAMEEVDGVVSPGLNLGYVGALEYARRSFECDFLWSIQDDMALRNDVLGALLRQHEEEPRLAVASPLLVRDGNVPARTRAGVFSNQKKTRWENYPFDSVTPEVIDLSPEFCFVSGSGALFRKAALDDVGGFNLDLFPLMHVDVDVCVRFLRQNWSLALVRDAHIDHEIQGSTPSIVSQVLSNLNTPVVQHELESGNFSPKEVPDQLDYDLIFTIARKSSHLFLDVAQEGSRRITELENKLVNNEEDAEALRLRLEFVYASASWRVTKPLRLIKVALTRSIQRAKIFPRPSSPNGHS